MAVAKRALLLFVFAALVLGLAHSQNCPTQANEGCPIGHYKSWDYMRRTDWGNSCPYYSTCKAGKQQSPINIPALPNTTLPANLQLNLGNIRVRLIRVGNYLNLPVNTNHTLFWGGRLMYLHRLEFHSPSEHKINGENAPFEVQLYFKYSEGSVTHTAAIAVLYELRCCDDAFLSRVVPSLPKLFACECGNNRTEFWAPFGEQCDQGPDNARLPDRCRPDCTLPYCGDAVKDSGEECDQGNKDVLPNRCRPNCKVPFCGDNTTDLLYPYSEQCDDGNTVSGDGCSSTCKKECGDKVVQGSEQCDMGEFNSDLPTSNVDVCRTNCLRRRCGDGIVDPGEECDEGTFNSDQSSGGSLKPNACRPNCKKPRCGDGVVDPLLGETCEPNRDLYTDATDPCTTTCKLFCGDGVRQISKGEECDAGAQNSNSSTATCRPNCMNPRCGDGIVDQNEQCDTVGATAACNANCTYRCGNGIVEVGEQCDDGAPSVNPNNGNSNSRANACRLDCRNPRCGDGILDFGEQCDQGANNSDTAPNACRTTCKLPFCGDRVADANEDCDDGNASGFTGCFCCKFTCGDGIRQPNEVCDDGPANSNTTRDRCRLNCAKPFCGDGVTDSDEECDFRSGKTPFCTQNCMRPFCGNGIVEKELGEECDEGTLNSYHTILGCSPICTVNRCGQTLTEVDANLQEIIRAPQVNAFCYQGSETHPPCTEGVQWFVLPDLRPISPTQYYAFTNVISKNNRAVSPLNGRNPLMCSSAQAINPRVGSVCGNGIREIGEQCDHGEQNSDIVPDACRTNCRANRCGDNVKDSDEECDGESWCTRTCKRDTRMYEKSSPRGCWNIANQGIWNQCSRDNTCYGNLQSPIRLPSVCSSNRPYNLTHPTHIQYNPTPIVLFNTGNDIVLPVASGGTFSWKGRTYALSHIEFHEPSEHYIGDKQFPFEVQLFHTSQNPGEKKVVALAVLFERADQKNKFLQPILDNLPQYSDCTCGNGYKESAMALPGGRLVPEQCDLGTRNSDNQPNGCRTNCQLYRCGDGVIDSGEICDDGLLNSRMPNQCRPNCVQPFCGDGVVDDQLFEECDDGNNANNDGCSSDCHRECGNGYVGPNEECDSGELNSDTRSNGCRTNCRKCYCGDNVVDASEQCDDGMMNSDSTPNSCRTNCRTPICGDGVVDNGEQCDGGAKCDANCRLLCGNGIIEAGEECDNGTKNSDAKPNFCRTNCKLSYCGDGVRDANEECDTGATNTYACQNCRIACGNGRLDSGEQCDNGCNNDDGLPNACRTTCLKAHCGDGVLDSGEQCDDGIWNSNSSNACRFNCRLPRCGDGIVDSGEQCDSSPGCSSDCKRLCGNGRVDAGEQCDNGLRNSDTAIGCCRTNCVLPRCGDGVTDANEECDDGPSNANGPNSCRVDCTKPTCGDGIVDYLYGEVCDQGARNSFTAIDGCSPKCTLNLCSQSVHFDMMLNPADLLPQAPGAYHYVGSLNSPPCTEGTEWFVFSSPAPISSCQLDQFRNVLRGNTRCLQATNGRPVTFLQETSVCGDGVVEGNEECDAGLLNSDSLPDSCRKNCRKARCGDGVQDSKEQCDGTPNCNSLCVLDCNASTTRSPRNTTAITYGEDETVINVNFASILAQ